MFTFIEYLLGRTREYSEQADDEREEWVLSDKGCLIRDPCCITINPRRA